MANKYQEALKKLKLFFGNSPYTKELTILQELVDKETPMKPVRKGKLNWLHCPRCDKSLYFENQPRCQDCGQKLDWSDTDE